jgi:hypothetical protein
LVVHFLGHGRGESPDGGPGSVSAGLSSLPNRASVLKKEKMFKKKKEMRPLKLFRHDLRPTRWQGLYRIV